MFAEGTFCAWSPEYWARKLGDRLRVVADDDVLGHDRAREAAVADRVEHLFDVLLADVEVRPVGAHAVLDARRRALRADHRQRVAARAVVAEQHRAAVVGAGLGDLDPLRAARAEQPRRRTSEQDHRAWRRPSCAEEYIGAGHAQNPWAVPAARSARNTTTSAESAITPISRRTIAATTALLLVPRAARRPPRRRRARAGRGSSAPRRRAAARRRTPPRAAAARRDRRGVRSSTCRRPRASRPRSRASSAEPWPTRSSTQKAVGSTCDRSGRRGTRARRRAAPASALSAATASAPATTASRHAGRYRADCHYVTLCHKR